MNEWKETWLKDGKVPRVLQNRPTLWAGLLAHWEQEATLATSGKNSSNRRSDRKGKGPATHNLGSTSKASRAQQLFARTGVRPSHLDVIRDVHTNRKTGEIQDPIAREIVENVEKLGVEYLQSQAIDDGTPMPTEVPLDKINEFTYEVTPKNRGRIYGLPEDSSSSASSATYYGAPNLVAQNEELTQRLSSLEERYEQERAEALQYREMEQQRRAMEDERRAREEERRAMEDERYRLMEAKMAEFFRNHGGS